MLTSGSSPLSSRFNSDSGLWGLGGRRRAAGTFSCAADGTHCGLEYRAGVESVRGGAVCGVVGQSLLLVALNWSDLRLHPAWLLTLAMIHHPLLAAAGALAGAGAAVLYARSRRLPLANTADTLAAPVALGLAFEQLGALLAGSGYGTEASVRWAVTYSNPLAARWSGTPLGIPLHPVQGYAALGFLTFRFCCWFGCRRDGGSAMWPGCGCWELG